MHVHFHHLLTHSLTHSLIHQSMFFQVLSEQLATSITNVVEKIHSQQFRISQRLQWAAGANSSLNTTIDEFQRTCNNHKAMLEKEEALFGEVEEMAKAVIHLESSHTRIPAQTASDRETIQYLQRCSKPLYYCVWCRIYVVLSELGVDKALIDLKLHSFEGFSV